MLHDTSDLIVCLCNVLFISKTTMHQTASNLSWIEEIHSTTALSSNHELNNRPSSHPLHSLHNSSSQENFWGHG